MPRSKSPFPRDSWLARRQRVKCADCERWLAKREAYFPSGNDGAAYHLACYARDCEWPGMNGYGLAP